MIIFHKYEIRLRPDETALELYAPDWEQAQNSKAYQELIDKYKPRSIQIEDTQHWYHNSEPNRAATDEEILRFTSDGMYLRDSRMEILRPFTFYRYFGDRSVLDPLCQKMQAEYEEYLTDWKACMNRSRDELYDKLEQICIVRTAKANVQDCGDCYPPEYMEKLCALERPLQSLSDAYGKAIGFPIRPEAETILKICERNRDRLSGHYQTDPAYALLNSHERRMECLDKNLDREYTGREQSWRQLDFDGIIDHAMEIFSLRQLYHSLRYEKELYSADHLDCLAALAEPLSYDEPRFTGERDMRACSLKLGKILPGMFPGVEVQPDRWDQPASNEQTSGPRMTL